jgi:hypothetical protein
MAKNESERREGRIAMTVHLRPAEYEELRKLRFSRGRSGQDVLAEAVNLVLRRHRDAAVRQENGE